MAEKKKFLLRIDSDLYAALEKWAADDLRSINSQIEFLLTNALKRSSRLRERGFDDRTSGKEEKEDEGMK